MEHAVVAQRVLGEGVRQRRGHEARVTGAALQVLQAGDKRLTAGILSTEAVTDAAAERQEFALRETDSALRS